MTAVPGGAAMFPLVNSEDFVDFEAHLDLCLLFLGPYNVKSVPDLKTSRPKSMHNDARNTNLGTNRDVG